MFAHKLLRKLALSFRLRRLRDCESGMAAVEFAFIAPMLSVMMLGVADVSWLALQRSDMHAAVRSGAQYVMAGGRDATEAMAIVRSSWTQAPADASLDFVKFCKCAGDEYACSSPCPDGSVPDAYTRFVISAPITGIFQHEQTVYSDTIRIR